MRLTLQQRERIRKAGLYHFGVVPLLFGSRIDDQRRGGDIDLFIPGNWSADEGLARRLAFCAELQQQLGEQKIDVILEHQPENAIQRLAKEKGVPV